MEHSDNLAHAAYQLAERDVAQGAGEALEELGEGASEGDLIRMALKKAAE